MPVTFPYRPRTSRRRSARLAALVPLAALLVSCGATTVTGSGGTGAYDGAELASAIPLPSITLTDTAGRPYDVQHSAQGKLAIYYFGYTNCPDVCPTTMADLAAALRKLDSADRARVQVVFVTTDPQHDTPARLRQWLGSFDPSFIGLRGSLRQVQAAAAKFGVDAENPSTDKAGKVTDTHGAQVIAFSPTDQQAHVVWLPGTKVGDYAHDMHTLLATT